MALELARIIYFTADMAGMAAFYRDVLGLELVVDEDGWKELRAGACIIALHRGARAAPRRSPKLAFHARDVSAVRAALVKRGAVMGEVSSGGGIDFCDGKDPDGNAFSISSRP